MRRVVVGLLSLGIVVGVSLTGSQPANAIVGGGLADPAGYPYWVDISAFDGYCAGVVIADSWVLTAAHCTFVGPIYVHVSDAVVPGGLSVFATEVPHPLWDTSPQHGHDLKLLHVTDGALSAVPKVQVGAPWDAGAYAAGNL